MSAKETVGMKQASTQRQAGLVSLLITMIMMVVISLIVIGIAEVSRRNSREALDNQLGAQAYYAAESGVNDAANYLQANLLYVSTAADQSNCTNFYSTHLEGNNKLNGNDVAYTCLFVNTHPTQLQQAPLTEGNYVGWPLMDANGGNIHSLTFSWKRNSALAASGDNCPTGGGSLPKATQWTCDYPILRVDLAGDAIFPDATELANNTHTGTIYMVPGTGSTSVNFTPGGNGLVHHVSCTSGVCKLTVNLPGNANAYVARISTLYGDSDGLTVTGASAGGPTQFAAAQAVIDATGRAQDELRRIQVRMPLESTGNSSPLPVNALQSTAGICKYFMTGPGYSSADYSPDASAECKYQ